MTDGAASTADDERARAPGAPFAFHDPEFVTWWLTSLYLFKPEEQAAIAQLLADAIHSPDAKREIEAFIQLRVFEGKGEQSELAEEASLSAGTSGSAVDVVFARVRELWKANPWMVTLGMVALVFFSGKAILLLGRELLRIVF